MEAGSTASTQLKFKLTHYRDRYSEEHSRGLFRISGVVFPRRAKPAAGGGVPPLDLGNIRLAPAVP